MALDIKGFLQKKGASVAGVAGVERFAQAPEGFHPHDVMAGCRAVVVFGIALPRALLKSERRITYLKAMLEGLAELDRLSLLAAIEIERHGGEAMPLPSDAPVDYWNEETKTAKGILSMKHAGELAGLGHIGKNTLLNNPHYGNRLMLGAVLTTLELPSDPLSKGFVCPPGCRICLDNCPQGALDGITLNQRRCRELVYGTDAHGQFVCNCNRCRTLCPQALRRPPVRERAGDTR
ncbi:epoxyqueuosine reductase [Rhizomicrobium electricum]|uniref:Epoxyqueuosine reductase n=1 Tax=Rhizomicrobium electricum TaxID=480070 RepID=A0ABN1F863_9PROT|nr:epoxyqueuosine reductase [Rhizomicrobium electricum]NIJ46759.1 epoxyqueuosine reductase QueG [Rhizomicrobium electricum]